MFSRRPAIDPRSLLTLHMQHRPICTMIILNAYNIVTWYRHYQTMAMLVEVVEVLGGELHTRLQSWYMVVAFSAIHAIHQAMPQTRA